MDKCWGCGKPGKYMGKLFDKKIFICDDCLPAFYENLEKYLEKLEQIEQKEEKKGNKFIAEVEEFYREGEKID